MKIGITLPSFVEDPVIPLAVAREAERAGLDGVFVYDHLFRERHDGTRRPALEGVALLGAVAQATTRVAVGALVFRASLRPPASLAAAIATVERIAPGRVIATIGAGDSQSRAENESFGIGFGTREDRVDALTQSVRAARATGARVWVGGDLAVVRAVAAREACGWNVWGSDVATFARHVRAIRSAADVADFTCSWGGLVVLDRDEDAGRAKAGALGASPDTLVGGPEQVAAGLSRYGEAGADWVIVAPVDSSDPANAALLGERVRPLVP